MMMTSRILVVLTSLLPALTAPCQAEDRSLEGGTEEAERQLREVYMRGFKKGAYETLLPIAEAGDPRAQFELSNLIEMGVDLGKAGDPPPGEQERRREALLWLRKAALQGHYPALDRLGTAYDRGWIGLPENRVLSDCWYAARDGQGTPQACDELEKRQLIVPAGSSSP